MKELKALIRDIELYTSSKKPLPILPRDLELLNKILEMLNEKET